MAIRHLQIIAAVTFSAATALAQSYTLTDLGTLGGESSQANAIGASGSVVGVAETKTGDYHAFLYAGRAMRDLGTFAGTTSTAVAINANGEIAGFYYDGGYHAFLWSDGKITETGNLDATANYSTAWALSNHGDVAGSSMLPGNREYAFLFTAGRMIDLGTLGGKESSARGVNSSLQVTGYAYDAGNH